MYVVIGAGGFLGSYLMQEILRQTDEYILAADCSDSDIPAVDRIEYLACDITKKEQVVRLNERMLMEKKPCKVLCLAAYHHPDLVAKYPRLAWNVNITSLAALLNTLENVDCLFYPSTDTVYGERSTEQYFRESDPTDPVNLYGRHKVIAERMVITYGYNAVRFPFLIGPSLLKTRKHFYDEIAAALLSGQPIQMYRDSYRSALDFGTAAGLLIKLMERCGNDAPPIVNIAGDRLLSKYDIGLMIADTLGTSKDLIIPVSVKDNISIFETPRASSAPLDNSLLKRILNLSEIKISL